MLWKLTAHSNDKSRHDVNVETLDMQAHFMAAKDDESEKNCFTSITTQPLQKTPLYKIRLAELEEVEVIEGKLEVTA